VSGPLASAGTPKQLRADLTVLKAQTTLCRGIGHPLFGPRTDEILDALGSSLEETLLQIQALARARAVEENRHQLALAEPVDPLAGLPQGVRAFWLHQDRPTPP
jgi:hypothetical protein